MIKKLKVIRPKTIVKFMTDRTHVTQISLMLTNKGEMKKIGVSKILPIFNPISNNFPHVLLKKQKKNSKSKKMLLGLKCSHKF